MYQPPSQGDVPYELADAFPVARSGPADQQPEPAAWKPAGRPPGYPPAAPRARTRPPAAIWLPYALLLGPGVISSVLTTGWILGAVTPGLVNSMSGWLPHLQELASSVALLVASWTLMRRRATGHATAGFARIPKWLVGLAGMAACSWALTGIVFFYRLDGGSYIAQDVMALAAVAWFLLLCADTGVLGHRSGAADRRGARLVALASMVGLAVVTPTAANAVLLGMVHEAPADVVQRLVQADSQGLDVFPTGLTASATAQTVVNSFANAIVEEFAFAVIVLALARCGWRRRSIVLLAAVLRAGMHLYYGPPGIAMGAFSGINAYSLLRWGRLWPLVLAHAAYDVLLWALSYAGWMPQGFWSNLAAGAAVCLAVAGLGVLLDMAVRRGPAATTAAQGAAA
jgi:hypothetical protein